MLWLWITLGVVAFLLIGGIAFMLWKTLPIAKNVYFNNLVRTSPDKWGWVCSAPDNEEQLAMWNAGIAWADTKMDKMTEVETENEGLHLSGQYFDFGNKKRCVIILAGRCECHKYSYYFAMPYEKIGCNVLVIDARAHGKSDGKYNTIGVGESRDLRAWIKLLEERFGMQEIYFHTICVGTSSALLLMTSPDCPESVKGLVTEGPYISFRETFRQHMIVDKRPVYPVLDMVMLNIKKYCGTDVYKTAPIKIIDKLHQRVLFIFGEEDVFSIPPRSRELFAKCGSKDKHIVWFKKGCHSHLRLNNTEGYDRAIADFMNNDSE